MDTLGTEKQTESVMQRFPLFRGYFVRIAIFLGPQKLFVILEVFTIRGFCYKRFHCIQYYSSS